MTARLNRAARIAVMEEATSRFAAKAAVRRRDRELKKVADKLEKVLARQFRKQGRLFIEELDERYRQSWETALGEAKNRSAMPGWQDAWERVVKATLSGFIQPLYEAIAGVFKFGGDEQFRDFSLDLSFHLSDPKAVDYLDNRAATRIAGINETSKAEVRDLLAGAMEKGWGYNKMAKALKERFKEFAVGRPQEHIDSRAHGIAVTEIGEAFSAGQHTVVERVAEVGLTMEKSWLTVGDDRVSDVCKGNEEEGWIPLKQAHESGHQHPLSHPY